VAFGGLAAASAEETAGSALIPGVNAVTVPVGAAVTGACTALAVTFGGFASLLGWISADPPDPNFAEIAQPVVIRMARVRGPGGRPLTGLLRMSARIMSLGGALVTSVERAQGAALAGDRDWVRRQSLTAADHAQHLAMALRRMPRLLSQARRFVVRSGARDARLTSSRLRAVQRRVRAHGLPAFLTRPLARLKVTRVERATLRRKLLSPDTPVPQLTTAGLLGNPAVRGQSVEMAGWFDAYATRVRQAYAG
jgi:hypothetical protein